MRTLVLSTCADPLSEYEFLLPIVAIVKEHNETRPSADHNILIQHYRHLADSDLHSSDRIIICGTAYHDDDYLKYLDSFKWLMETNLPVLGVCSGMQVLALAFGARLAQGQEIGMVEVDTIADNPLCTGTFQAYALHKYRLDGLEDFEVLAVSDAGAQVIRHREHPILGVLFHPEVRQEDVVRRFLNTFD